MKLKSKDSRKFLGVCDKKICLTEKEYQWEQLNSDKEYFYIVPLNNDAICITPSDIIDGEELTLEVINSDDNSQLWKWEDNYLINKLERKKGKIKTMCMDVCCERKKVGISIIIFHKKTSCAKNTKNQQWDII